MSDVVVPEIHVSGSEAFPGDAAARIAEEIRGVIETRGQVRLGLAGGSTPEPVYVELASSTGIDWTLVDFFWGDERHVGPEDPQSNYQMAQRAFGGPFRAGRVFRIDGALPADDAANNYAAALGEQPLDLLLLGMGRDGHTASLFPNDDSGSMPGSDDTEGRVVVTRSPEPPLTRISLSLETLNAARLVMFLIVGANKAARLAEVFDQIVSEHPSLPAARIQPKSGRLLWLLDTEAASGLDVASARATPRTQKDKPER